MRVWNVCFQKVYFHKVHKSRSVHCWWNTYTMIPIAQIVEHHYRNVSIMGSVPNYHTSWKNEYLSQKKMSAKCINVICSHFLHHLNISYSPFLSFPASLAVSLSMEFTYMLISHFSIFFQLLWELCSIATKWLIHDVTTIKTNEFQQPSWTIKNIQSIKVDLRPLVYH